VFISYARENESEAQDLGRKLEEQGINVWWDRESIPPGTDWETTIEQGMKRADFVIICLSTKMPRQGYIYQEIRMAVKLAYQMRHDTTLLLPVRLDDCEIPSKVLPFQSVDLFRPDGFNRLVRAVRSEWKA